MTLGVNDIARSRRFYEALGFSARDGSNADVVFLAAGGTMLGLFGRAALAHDASVADTPTGFAAISLARNVGSTEEADRVVAEAIAAGATLVKAAQPVFWGGYSGYFADPDGHLWEVVWNPQLILAD